MAWSRGYLKTFDLPSEDLSPGTNGLLDFGRATPIKEPTPLPQHSMKAYLEVPVREAAEVWVNGERAGFLWHPPYTIDVARWLLRAGKNNLRIIVGNTAINSLAGRVLPTYRLLHQRYGERFVPLANPAASLREFRTLGLRGSPYQIALLPLREGGNTGNGLELL